MGPLEQIIHTFNFIAPAWGVALFCVLTARWLARRWLPLAHWGVLAQTLVGGLLGTLVLVGGVLWLGVDGKMASYSALIVVCGTAQWLMCRGWQR